MGRAKAILRTAIPLSAAFVLVPFAQPIAAHTGPNTPKPYGLHIGLRNRTDGGNVVTAPQVLYVVNQNGDTVSAMNEEGSLIGTISLASPEQDSQSSPDSIAFNRSGTSAYVLSSAGSIGYVDVLSVTQAQLSKVVPLADGPGSDCSGGQIAVNPRRNIGYATCPAFGTVRVFNTTTNTALKRTIHVGVGPSGIAFSPSGLFAYVANQDSDSVSVINSDTDSVTSTIKMPTEGNPDAVAFNPSGQLAYVASVSTSPGFQDGTLSIIDTKTSQVLHTTTVGVTPDSVAVNPSGTLVYVANQEGPTISVLDATTGDVVDTITSSLFYGPSALAINQSGTFLYSVEFGVTQGFVTLINPENNGVLGNVPAGAGATAVAVN